MSILSFADFQGLSAEELSDIINLRLNPLAIEMPDGQLLRVISLELHARLMMKAMGKTPSETILYLLDELNYKHSA